MRAERRHNTAMTALASSPKTVPRPVGVILAGGLSRRMFEHGEAGGRNNGLDKGLLPLGATTMLGQVIARLAPQVDRIVLNVNGDPARFKSFGLPTTPDPIAGFVGPLAGVLAGMRWTATHQTDATHIVTTSADAPFIPKDLVVRLVTAALSEKGSIAMARSGGDWHPVIGCWPVALADDLEAALRSGTRKVLNWTDRHGTIPVDFDAVDIKGTMVDPFFNANTPAELELARTLIRKSAP